MSQDTDILQKIPDQKPVRVFLSIKNEHEQYRAQGIFERTEAPKFRLLFTPGELPENIDLSKGVVVSVDMGGPTISIEANILERAENDQALNMTLTKSINHEQMREFFRVDAVTPVISKSFSGSRSQKEKWLIAGESLDISGSGVLATFDRKIPDAKFITLEITLPTEDPQTGENETVEIVAHQVRSQELDDGRYQVALHYDDITDEDRDKIIGSCLVLQRKMLRLKVRLKEES